MDGADGPVAVADGGGGLDAVDVVVEVDGRLDGEAVVAGTDFLEANQTREAHSDAVDYILCIFCLPSSDAAMALLIMSSSALLPPSPAPVMPPRLSAIACCTASSSDVT